MAEKSKVIIREEDIKNGSATITKLGEDVKKSFVPDGYGLSKDFTEMTPITNLNNITKTGWYKYNTGASYKPNSRAGIVYSICGPNDILKPSIQYAYTDMAASGAGVPQNSINQYETWVRTWFNPPVSKSTTLLSDSFEGYASLSEVLSAGKWQKTGTGSYYQLTSNVTEATSKCLAFRAGDDKDAAFAYALFGKKIAIRPGSGLADDSTSIATLGKNAKITIQYDAATQAKSGNSTIWAIGNGNSYDNMAVATSLRTDNSNPYYMYYKAKYLNIPNEGTENGIIPNTYTAYWYKIRIVMTITDANGNFISGGPNVKVYYKDFSGNWIDAFPNINRAILKEVSYIDRFTINTTASDSSAYIDNVSIVYTYDDTSVSSPSSWRRMDMDGTVIPTSYSSLNDTTQQNLTLFNPSGTVALNYPTNDAYFIKVTCGSSRILQEAFNVTTANQYTRTYNGLTWTPWIEAVNSVIGTEQGSAFLELNEKIQQQDEIINMLLIDILGEGGRDNV